MTELFNKCIPVILKHEGGFQNSEFDAGNWVGGYQTGTLVGTKYGIAAKYFPNEDIKNLTVDRAKVLYFNYYWLPMNLDGLPDEAALEIFDFGVNAGRWKAVRTAQQLVGVKADGVIGPVTKKAITEFDGFVSKYKQCRKVFYEHIATKRNNQKFLRGWLNRVDNTYFGYV